MMRAKMVFDVRYTDGTVGPIRLETPEDRRELSNPVREWIIDTDHGLETRSDYDTLREFVESHAVMHGASIGIPEEQVMDIMGTPVNAETENASPCAGVDEPATHANAQDAEVETVGTPAHVDTDKATLESVISVGSQLQVEIDASNAAYTTGGAPLTKKGAV